MGGQKKTKCSVLRGGREAAGKWIIRKAQLKDNLYFINAAKLHYCSHTQSYCPHSRLRPGGEGVMEERKKSNR